MLPVLKKYQDTLLQINDFLSTFKSQQASKLRTIFHEVNFSIVYIIHLMKCTLKEEKFAGRKSRTNQFSRGKSRDFRDFFPL